MSTYAAPEKKKPRVGVPVIGLVLAIAFFAFSFGISTPLVEFAEKNNDDLKNAFSDLRKEFNQYDWYQDTKEYHSGKVVEIIVTLVLWFIFMSISMFVVSAALYGTDPEKTAWKEMGPSPADKKAMIKQMKKDLRAAKKRSKAAQNRK